MTRSNPDGSRDLIPINTQPPELTKVEPNPQMLKNPETRQAYENLSLRHQNNRLMTLNASRERLGRLGESMERTIVTPENMAEVRTKIDEILKWPEGIGGNIELEQGDKFTWNKEAGTMIVLSKTGGMKFGIRLIPETWTEYRQNANLARDMQNAQPEWNENIEIGGKVLGDWLVRRGPWPGKNNSCGASCGELLNQFGFRKILPQSGRDGKDWDTIMERHLSDYFKKIPVSHPKDAPAGSMIVFNENAQLGTAKRRQHWHAEMKGSDGKFYSYYKTENPAGSSRTNEKDSEKYKRLTGFTGYAYVYNGKIPPR